jgi:hypothetical protein
VRAAVHGWTRLTHRDYVLAAGTPDGTEKEYRAKSSGNQHNSRTSVGDGRDMSVSIFISIVIVVVALVSFPLIVVGIRHGGQNKSGGY